LKRRKGMEKRSESKGRFDEFEENLPEKMVLGRAGPDGEDITLPKRVINGVVVYMAEVDVSLWVICQRIKTERESRDANLERR